MSSSTLADIIKKYDVTLIEEFDDVSRLPSGSLQLDRALGGGWPRGRISELWGEEHNGKSLITLIASGRTIMTGGSVVLLDMENAFNKTWASHFVDVKNERFAVLHQNENTYGEAILNMIHKLCENKVDLIILDSKDALVFGAEVEGETGNAFFGIRSQRFSHFARRLAQILGDSETAVLLVSQARDKIGDTYSPITVSGGRALKHAYAIRVQMMAQKKIEATTDGVKSQVGFELNARTNKNNTYKNKQSAAVPVREFMTENGSIWTVDNAGEAFDIATELGLLTLENGKVYAGSGNAYFCDDLLGSKNVALQKLRAEPILLGKLEAVIRQRMGWLP